MDDLGEDADRMKRSEVRVIVVRPLLGDDQNSSAIGGSALDRASRLLTPDKDRRNQLRKEHDVPHRRYRNHGSGAARPGPQF
jgi:hypothetical protein